MSELLPVLAACLFIIVGAGIWAWLFYEEGP